MVIVKKTSSKDVVDLGEELKRAQKSSGKTVSQVCREAGFSRSYWYQVVSEKEAISEKTLKKLKSVLGIPD